MNRLLAALLICILQVCQAHCFAEEAGLVGGETCACCAVDQPDNSSQTLPCEICDIVRTGVVTAWSVVKCADPAWTPLIVVPAPTFTTGVFAETALSGIRSRPETADPPVKVWEALVRTAVPVRGPSVA